MEPRSYPQSSLWPASGNSAEKAGTFAFERLSWLAELDPFDAETQRHLLSVYLRVGRASEAVRRYEALRSRMRRELGTEPDFRLSDLSEENGAPSRDGGSPRVT